MNKKSLFLTVLTAVVLVPAVPRTTYAMSSGVNQEAYCANNLLHSCGSTLVTLGACGLYITGIHFAFERLFGSDASVDIGKKDKILWRFLKNALSAGALVALGAGMRGVAGALQGSPAQ